MFFHLRSVLERPLRPFRVISGQLALGRGGGVVLIEHYVQERGQAAKHTLVPPHCLLSDISFPQVVLSAASSTLWLDIHQSPSLPHSQYLNRTLWIHVEPCGTQIGHHNLKISCFV